MLYGLSVPRPLQGQGGRRMERCLGLRALTLESHQESVGSARTDLALHVDGRYRLQLPALRPVVVQHLLELFTRDGTTKHLRAHLNHHVFVVHVETLRRSQCVVGRGRGVDHLHNRLGADLAPTGIRTPEQLNLQLGSSGEEPGVQPGRGSTALRWRFSPGGPCWLRRITVSPRLLDPAHRPALLPASGPPNVPSQR